MKKLFAALASAALVGTVFAQTAVPASATQPQGGAAKDQAKVVKEMSTTPAKADKNTKSAGMQGNEVKAQASATKEKADVKADASKSAAKGTHHKASKTKAAHAEAGMAKPDVSKAATSMDKTKNQ
ncbi:hypothetical protein [Cupriavidus lacunae]|uniref:Acid-shock protein n=1 Tax=Cupriavidus lacunae TaxID=2666307 RepID=A0A370NKR0_9BURK|nr:hypothetical protein [Cupriavidus lacunae]RDK06167.1 hypothetical protein DN412_32975 [Cupriavidus lacunae]